MVFHHFARHFHRAKNFGMNVYNHAQRLGSAIDKGAGIAKRAYGIVAPALRELGLDTSRADRIADKGFTNYNQLRDRVSNANDVIGRTAGRLSGIGM